MRAWLKRRVVGLDRDEPTSLLGPAGLRSVWAADVPGERSAETAADALSASSDAAASGQGDAAAGALDRKAPAGDEAPHGHGDEAPHTTGAAGRTSTTRASGGTAIPGRAAKPDAGGVGAGLQLPRLGFVGAGRVGLALGIAFHRAGWPVAAVASRDQERRRRFVEAVAGARAVAHPDEMLDEVDLAFLTVPDDAIASVAGAVRLYSGQAIVHTSGLLPASVLTPALAAGAEAGSFHPLVAFAETETAIAALRGATVAIEGDAGLLPLLAEMAHAVGAEPVRVEAEGKPAYHAAAVLAAGGFVALLDAIATLGRSAGLDERGSLAIYGPLVRQALTAAEHLGIGRALTGPIVRGDAGTLAAHLDALRRLAPEALELYSAAARREVSIALARGELSPDQADVLSGLLAKVP